MRKKSSSEKNKLKMPEKPDIPQEKDLIQDLPSHHLLESEVYENVKLSACEISGTDGVTFERSYFESVKIINTSFKRLRLNDVCFNKCDLSNTEWKNVSLNRVQFINCKLVGFQAVESNFSDVTFEKCQGNFSQFNFAKFDTVYLKNCNLEDVSFLGSNLSSVKFQDCVISNAILSEANLKNVDFRSSIIEGLQINLEQVKDIVLEPHQAVYLLQRCTGVSVKLIGED